MNPFTSHAFYPYTYFNPSSFHSDFNNFVFQVPHPYMSLPFNFNSTTPNKPQIFKMKSDIEHHSPKKMENMVLQKYEEKNQESKWKNGETKEELQKNSNRTTNVQKENRNVASNLLRIFFKNILELNSYDDIIISVISKNQLQCTVEDFLRWLEKFKINYKNYIKPTQIKRILGVKNSSPYQLIFRVLLNIYMKDIGLSHCLTSKRIDHSCIKRHLEGLKKLLELGSDKKN